MLFTAGSPFIAPVLRLIPLRMICCGFVNLIRSRVVVALQPNVFCFLFWPNSTDVVVWEKVGKRLHTMWQNIYCFFQVHACSSGYQRKCCSSGSSKFRAQVTPNYVSGFIVFSEVIYFFATMCLWVCGGDSLWLFVWNLEPVSLSWERFVDEIMQFDICNWIV